MITKKIKNINYYLNLPWSYSIKEDNDNKGKKIFIVGIEELPGIITDGYSKAEAFENLKEALEGAVELYKKVGDKIPEPKASKKIKSNLIK